MNVLIDSYSESNADYVVSLYTDGYTGYGESFLNPSEIHFNSCKFYIGKNGLPTGNCYAKLYEHVGTFGSSGVPTGNPIAVSDPVDVTTLAQFVGGIEDLVLKEFIFSGVNKVVLSANTYYVVTIEYTGSVSSENSVVVGVDETNPSHAGNGVSYDYAFEAWLINSGEFPFYIYGYKNIRAGNGTVGGGYVAQTYVSGHPKLLQQVVRIFTDYVNSTDNKIISLWKRFIDIVDITDSTLFKRLKIFIDTVTVSDFAIVHVLKSFVDNVLANDVIQKVLPRKSLVDSVDTSDIAVNAIHKIVSDDVEVSDLITKKTTKSFLDTIHAIDVKRHALLRQFIDSLNVSDNVTKHVTIVLRSTVVATDSIRRWLNGLLILWDKVTKSIGNWTKRSKDIESFSSVSKPTGEWNSRGRGLETYTQVSKPDEDWTKLKDEQHNE